MEPLSKAKFKIYKSLKIKKYRDKYNLFIAEGSKIIADFMRSGAKIEAFIGEKTGEVFRGKHNEPFYEVSKKEIKELSSLKTPADLIAIVNMPKQGYEICNFQNKITLALDGVRDPGNLGTIIRICDWFGIHTIICSKETADTYNPKVVQATMGSLLRVNVFYEDLSLVLREAKEKYKIPVYGTFMNGDNIYEEELSRSAIVVMGNEGKGISSEIEQLIDSKLTIPDFSAVEKKPESLNVAMATSIVCSEFRRRFSC